MKQVSKSTNAKGEFGKNITKQPKNKPRNGITPEFKRWVKEFMDKHEDALRELAKR